MSRLTRDGTAEPVSRDQILRHARGQGNIHFPCSADHEQDWQPYPVDPYSAVCNDHTYIHVYFVIVPFFLSFLFCFVTFFFCCRWSFVDVPLIFFYPADHVPDWQPRTRILLSMVEAQSVNIKKTTTIKKNVLFFAFSVFVANPKNYFKRWPIPLVVGDFFRLRDRVLGV